MSLTSNSALRAAGNGIRRRGNKVKGISFFCFLLKRESEEEE
jgi:hypothetical protein